MQLEGLIEIFYIRVSSDYSKVTALPTLRAVCKLKDLYEQERQEPVPEGKSTTVGIAN